MIEPASFVINAWSHAVDFVMEPPPPADPAAELQASARGERPDLSLRIPVVFTGVYSGPVEVTVEVRATRPELTAPGWEDVHEVSLLLPEGRAFFNPPGGSDMVEVGTVTGVDSGSYRARLHATGRDTAYDLVVESPVERHLIQFWPDPPSPVSELSSESTRGKGVPAFLKLVTGAASQQPLARSVTAPKRIAPGRGPGPH